MKVDNALCAIWSMMLPGLGQLLKGQVIPGVIWAVLTGSAYFTFFWPGLMIHAACILDAALNKGPNSWIGVKSWPQRIIIAVIIVALLIYIYIRNF